jgi:uncharacterized membrane-anchored protein
MNAVRVLIVIALVLLAHTMAYRDEVGDGWTASLFTQPPGCHGDWVSGGTYCNREFVDANGHVYRVVTRSY